MACLESQKAIQSPIVVVPGPPALRGVGFLAVYRAKVNPVTTWSFSRTRFGRSAVPQTGQRPLFSEDRIGLRHRNLGDRQHRLGVFGLAAAAEIITPVRWIG